MPYFKGWPKQIVALANFFVAERVHMTHFAIFLRFGGTVEFTKHTIELAMEILYCKRRKAACSATIPGLRFHVFNEDPQPPRSTRCMLLHVKEVNVMNGNEYEAILEEQKRKLDMINREAWKYPSSYGYKSPFSIQSLIISLFTANRIDK